MNLDALMLDPRFALHWQMSRQERLAIVAILQDIKPQLSLEIGTYHGGSLQVLAAYSQRVISVDINDWVPTKLSGLFSNVEFRTGDSLTLLPGLCAELSSTGNTPEFVLVDGAHYVEGVKADIDTLLTMTPAREMVIVMHDSFNPSCRLGMLAAAWHKSPHVHEVEIDFIPGALAEAAFDTAGSGEMWGGLGCAILKPEPRQGPLEIKQSHRGMFEATKAISAHAAADMPKPAAARSLYRKGRSLAGRIKRSLLAKGQASP